MRGGVVPARARNGCGKHRRLRVRERRSGRPEVPARRRLRAVHAIAPLDHVEIHLENAALAESALQANRQQNLRHLAERIARGAEVQVLRELLRDRAPAADDTLLLPVHARGLLHLGQVESVVSIERRVLTHENRTPQARRDTLDRHPPVIAADSATRAPRFVCALAHHARLRRRANGERRHVGRENLHRDPHAQAAARERRQPSHRAPGVSSSSRHARQSARLAADSSIRYTRRR